MLALEVHLAALTAIDVLHEPVVVVSDGVGDLVLPREECQCLKGDGIQARLRHHIAGQWLALYLIARIAEGAVRIEDLDQLAVGLKGLGKVTVAL